MDDDDSTTHPEQLPVEYLFTLTGQVERAATLPDGPTGPRVVVNCAEGTFSGPRLSGTIVAPSGDWVRLGPGGSMRIDVRMLLRTDDGADILMTYIGVALDGGRSIRVAPLFETGDERYSWLNTVQGVATGTSAGGQVDYTVYCLL